MKKVFLGISLYLVCFTALGQRKDFNTFIGSIIQKNYSETKPLISKFKGFEILMRENLISGNGSSSPVGYKITDFSAFTLKGKPMNGVLVLGDLQHKSLNLLRIKNVEGTSNEFHFIYHLQKGEYQYPVVVEMQLLPEIFKGDIVKDVYYNSLDLIKELKGKITKVEVLDSKSKGLESKALSKSSSTNDPLKGIKELIVQRNFEQAEKELLEKIKKSSGMSSMFQLPGTDASTSTRLLLYKMWSITGQYSKIINELETKVLESEVVLGTELLLLAQAYLADRQFEKVSSLNIKYDLVSSAQCRYAFKVIEAIAKLSLNQDAEPIFSELKQVTPYIESYDWSFNRELFYTTFIPSLNLDEKKKTDILQFVDKLFVEGAEL